MSSTRLFAGVLALGAAMFGASDAKAALSIGGGATQNVICAAHVCRATRPAAVLNASSLANMLASSDVTVISGSKAQDIVVRYAFSWTSGHRLTLDSYRSITVDFAVTVTGAGAATLTTNDGGTGGAFSTQFPGRIDFWDLSSSLAINGASYTLVGDIATLASDIAANPSGHYALAKNYDASPDGMYSDAPVATTFTGAFEGLGHIIEHLSVHGAEMNAMVGLFSRIGPSAYVENIGLTEVVLRGAFQNQVGALAALNAGTISNAYAKGRIRGGQNNYVGGLVGENNGVILDSYTTGTVGSNTATILGGLAGVSWGAIRNSHSTTEITATGRFVDSYVGGLVGEFGGVLSDSWASGAVLVGDNNGLYNQSNAAGGLVGLYVLDAGDNPDFRNCYATGNVTSGERTNNGGLIGILQVQQGTPVPVISAYATGKLVSGVEADLGGLVGYNLNQGTFSDTYWDTGTSGITNPSQGVGNIPNQPGVTGLSDAQLTSGLPAGFDPTVWAEKPGINGGRPYLIANPPSQ